MQTIDFYFDYLSPYSYLAACTIDSLCARTGASLRWCPVLFPALLNHWGQRGPAEIAPKALHAFKDCLRHARRRQLPFTSPRYHPFNPLLALRVTSAADSEQSMGRIVRALFALGWQHGDDLADRAAIARVLSEIGLDAGLLMERAGSNEIKKRLRQATATAIGKGVFGVPTMIIDDELFWGFDQFDNVELHLTHQDPIAGRDLNAILPRAPSARRLR